MSENGRERYSELNNIIDLYLNKKAENAEYIRQIREKKQKLKTAQEMQNINDDFYFLSCKAKAFKLLNDLFEREIPEFLKSELEIILDTPVGDYVKDFSGKIRFTFNYEEEPSFASDEEPETLIVRYDDDATGAYMEEFMKKYVDIEDGAFFSHGFKDTFFLAKDLKKLVSVAMAAIEELKNDRMLLEYEAGVMGVTIEDLINYDYAKYLDYDAQGIPVEPAYVDLDTGYIRGVKEDGSLVEDHRPKPKR